MMALGCGACAAMQAAGMRGLVAEPVRGVVMEPVGDVGTQSAGLLLGGGALAGGAISGALVGGLSAGSWRGAGTGALLAGGLQGIFGGSSMLLFPETRVAGAAIAAVGAIALFWGGSRAVVDMGRRRY